MMQWKRLFGLVSTPNANGEKPLSFRESLRALRTLPPFFRLVWETHRGFMLANMALRVLDACLPVSSLYVGKLIVDEVVMWSKTGFEATGDGWLSFLPHSLLLLILAEFGLALLSAMLGRATSLVDALLGDLVSNATSVRIIEHAATLDLQQFELPEFYDKLDRARRQTTNRTVLLSQVFSQVQDGITIVFLGAGLIAFEPWLLVLLVLAVIPAFLAETWFNNRSYSLARGWTPERRELDYLRFVGASDQSAKEIKLFGLAGFLTEKFAALADQYYRVNRALAIRRASWGLLFNALGDAGYYAAYLVIAARTIAGKLSLGDLTFLAGAFRQLRQLLQRMLSRFSDIAQSALYLQDLFDFLEMQPTIVAPQAALPFPNPIRDGFVFDNVGFRYPESERWVLRNLNFTLQAGEKLALVGENGAGKTTLVKLLSRLYEPSEGRILLDGHDLRAYDPAELHRAIGVIFQDFVRFQLTAAENVAVGDIAGVNDDPRIETAAHQSLADEVIATLPLRYNTPLGKRFKDGVELSGGQWQKVALARAYMRDAQLLILDEPTAALDARAEYEAFNRFAELTQGKSAVLISHRFSTVRMANRILVLQHGTVAEIGSHEELLANGGIYAELFNLQAQGYR